MPVGPIAELGHAGGSLPTWGMIAPDDTDAPQLQWPVSNRTYHAMRTDSQVGMLIQAVTLPILRRRFVIDPADARDEVVELVAGDLGLPVSGTDTTPPRGRRRFSHYDHLRLALLALWYGHNYFEQVGEIDAAGMWRLRKLAPRLPRSILDITVDPDGGLRSISQQGIARSSGDNRAQRVSPRLLLPGRVDIGVDRLVAYVWEREGADWTGRSMLRPLYKHWLLKDRYLRIDLGKNERFGLGIPVGTAPPGGDPTEYQRMASAITAGEGGGVGLPSGATIGVQGVNGTLPDTLASLRYQDEQMARAFLAMFAQLGQTETGSRALGDTFVDFFTAALDAVVRWYCTTVTGHVVEDMVDWNFGTGEPIPSVTWVTDDDEPLATTELVQLVDAGVLTLSPADETWVRSRHSLPARDDDLPPDVESPSQAFGYDLDYGVLTVNERRAQIGLAPIPGGDTLAAPASSRVDAGRGDRRRGRVSAAAQTMTVQRDRVGHREPYPHEVRASTDFDRLQSEWEAATGDLVDDWGAVRDAQIGDLAGQVVAAVDASDADALAQIAAPVLGADLIEDRLVEAADTAADAAAAEVAAQGRTVARPSVDDLRASLSVRASATAHLLARGLSDAAARQALLRFGVDGPASGTEVADAVAQHLSELGDGYLNDVLGGAVTSGQNLGRVAVFDAAPPASYYGSELLDANTCNVCAAADGDEYADLAEAASVYPTGGHRDCLGGPRCRGTLVAVYPDEEPT